MNNLNKIAIVGAGPSGVMAGIFAKMANKNNQVYIFDKNEKIGKKLYITGKGRCNVTNSAPVEDFINNITNNPYFMYSALYSFTNEQTIDFFEENGLKLKEERGGRIFPVSDKSSDVIKVLENLIEKNKINLNLKEKILDIKKNNDKFEIITEIDNYEFDKVIIATGGYTYQSTGSTGFGYKIGKKFGHEIVYPVPALVPFKLKDNYIKEIEGTSLRNVELVIEIKGKEKYREFGEMIFTRNGISGPIVLTLSSYIGRYKKEDINIYIDLKPALSYEKLDNRLLRDFSDTLNKDLLNSLDNLLLKKLIPIIIKKSKIDERKKINQISKEERKALVKTIKKFILEYNGLEDINRGIITNGGISVDDIDPSTMESKKVKNLYFVGEVIDINALTGGYNLQIAYSTGYLAGINAGGI